MQQGFELLWEKHSSPLESIRLNPVLVWFYNNSYCCVAVVLKAGWHHFETENEKALWLEWAEIINRYSVIYKDYLKSQMLELKEFPMPIEQCFKRSEY